MFGDSSRNKNTLCISGITTQQPAESGTASSTDKTFFQNSRDVRFES